MKKKLEIGRFLFKKWENILLFQDPNKPFDNFTEIFSVFMTQHSPK